MQLFTCYNDCHPFLVNITFNLCSLDGKSGSFYLNAIFRSADPKYTNILPAKCPIREGVLLYSRNASVNLNLFKKFPIPDNTYQLGFSAYTYEGNVKTNIISGRYKVRVYHTDENKRKPTKKTN